VRQCLLPVILCFGEQYDLSEEEKHTCRTLDQDQWINNWRSAPFAMSLRADLVA
jgi:hypothetical protein